LKKVLKPQPLTRTEKRAAELDLWVKRHAAECREADAAKKSRLRELRMAREALQKDSAVSPQQVDCPPKQQLHTIQPRVRRIWVSGPGARNDSVTTKKRDEA
jgi:hypothetical protein